MFYFQAEVGKSTQCIPLALRELVAGDADALGTKENVAKRISETTDAKETPTNQRTSPCCCDSSFHFISCLMIPKPLVTPQSFVISEHDSG